MGTVHELDDVSRLELLKADLIKAGLFTRETMTGGNCWALFVSQDDAWLGDGTTTEPVHVLITNGDAQLPYLIDPDMWPNGELDRPAVDEEIVALVYQDSDDEGAVIIEHDATDGLLPNSIILAAVRSALEAGS